MKRQSEDEGSVEVFMIECITCVFPKEKMKMKKKKKSRL